MVLRAAGINCDQETQFAWRLAGACCDVVHLNRLIEQPLLLDDYDILTLPGGFSYGDDIAAGRILATRIVLHLADAVRRFVDRDRAILGICNGFQVLCRSGVLTGGAAGAPITLGFNDNGVYTCRWVAVRCDIDHSVFLEKGRVYSLPMAHAEGRFSARRASDVDASRIALRYVAGDVRQGPINPNGSLLDVAALTDRTGRVLGMMPHPERFVRPVHHPVASMAGDGEPDGLSIFRAAIKRFQ